MKIFKIIRAWVSYKLTPKEFFWDWRIPFPPPDVAIAMRENEKRAREEKFNRLVELMR